MLALLAAIFAAVATILHLIKSDPFIVQGFLYTSVTMLALHCVWPFSFWSSSPGRRRVP